MANTTYQPLISAIQETFKTEQWTFGNLTKKGTKTQKTISEILKKAPSQILVRDLQKIVYDLWESGVVEVIPPKPGQRAYHTRLVKGVIRDDVAIRKAYDELLKETRSVSVYFSDLTKRSKQSLINVHEWALETARQGKGELSEGDYSLAPEEHRQGSFLHNGKKFLLIGLLN